MRDDAAVTADVPTILATSAFLRSGGRGPLDVRPGPAHHLAAELASELGELGEPDEAPISDVSEVPSEDFQYSVEEVFADFKKGLEKVVKPEDVVPVGSVEELTVPGGAGERDARLYKPEGDGPWPTLVYLHGGGFVVGDLDTHD